MTTYSQRAPFYNAISSTARVTSAIMYGHMAGSAKLIFLCGKMAAGKSTLARELADRENAVLLVQDDFVTALFPQPSGPGPFFEGDRQSSTQSSKKIENGSCFRLYDGLHH